jgi:hypothetical protein
MSHTQPADRRLILTECAVDALSYAALLPDAEDPLCQLGWQTKLAAKGHWSKRLSQSYRQGPKSWRHSTPMMQDASWWR